VPSISKIPALFLADSSQVLPIPSKPLLNLHLWSECFSPWLILWDSRKGHLPPPPYMYRGLPCTTPLYREHPRISTSAQTSWKRQKGLQWTDGCQTGIQHQPIALPALGVTPDTLPLGSTCDSFASWVRAATEFKDAHTVEAMKLSWGISKLFLFIGNKEITNLCKRLWCMAQA